PALRGGAAHQLELELLPAQAGPPQQPLGGGAGVQAGTGDAAQVPAVVGDARSGPAEGERGPHHERVPELAGGPLALADRVAGPAAGDLRPEAGDDVLEPLPVLPGGHRLRASTPYLASVPASCRATAALSAVWPPSVGSTASGRSAAMTFSSTSGVIGST